MSFCQNKCQGHQNHHCVHAHNCTSHNHKNVNKNCKKNKNVDLMPTIPNKSFKHLKKIDEQNQQCHFNQNYGGFVQRQACQNCKKLSEQIITKKSRYEEIRKQMNQLQKKNSKICEENRQLHGVIQYYREELGRITKCSSEDARNQIKRHMKQNTQLITKNKSFQHKLYQYQQIIQKLTKQNEELYKKINELKAQKNQVNLSYNLILQKFRKLKAEDSNKQGDMSVERKKNEQVQQRYQIIVEQIRSNLQKNTKQNRKLSNQNQNLKEQVEVYKVKLSNNQKISKMEIQSIIQREKVLKMKIQSHQKQIKQLREQLSKTEQALKLKEEELLFSKKVIQKQLKHINQNKQLFNKLNDKQNQDQNQHHHNHETHIHISQPLGQHNRNDQQTITELKKQIIILKQKIIALEGQNKGKGGHNIQSIQQYVITIGASEAFKRIIDQKNQLIKKLIKQKEALLKKIT